MVAIEEQTDISNNNFYYQKQRFYYQKQRFYYLYYQVYYRPNPLCIKGLHGHGSKIVIFLIINNNIYIVIGYIGLWGITYFSFPIFFVFTTTSPKSLDIIGFVLVVRMVVR